MGSANFTSLAFFSLQSVTVSQFEQRGGAATKLEQEEAEVAETKVNFTVPLLCELCDLLFNPSFHRSPGQDQSADAVADF